jgi:hypothetical protein
VVPRGGGGGADRAVAAVRRKARGRGHAEHGRAGQPGTAPYFLPVACGGAGQSGMSLAVWRPVAPPRGPANVRARPGARHGGPLFYLLVS